MPKLDLTISPQPWGTVLEGRVELAEPMRLILFAWNRQELAWAKAPGIETSAEIFLCYYPSPIGRIQLITRVGMGSSTELMLSPNQCPIAGAECDIEPNKVSILYRTANHGVGLIAVSKNCTQSRRKKLWHLRSDSVSDELRIFVPAYGRSGLFSEHPFEVASQQ